MAFSFSLLDNIYSQRRVQFKWKKKELGYWYSGGCRHSIVKAKVERDMMQNNNSSKQNTMNMEMKRPLSFSVRF